MMMVEAQGRLEVGGKAFERMVTAPQKPETELRGSLPLRLRIRLAFVGFANRFEPLPTNHE